MGALTVLQYLSDRGAAGAAGICLLDQSPRIVTDSDWRCGLFGDHSHHRQTDLVRRLRRDFVRTVIEECAPALPGVLRRAFMAEGWLRRGMCRVLAGLPREALTDLMESAGNADFRATAASLQVPALVVLGARSHHYGGVPLAAWYGTTLPRGQVLTYQASAHSPHRDEPTRLAVDLRAFARRCAG